MRSYLHGAKKVSIYIYLYTFTLGSRNCNATLKKWKSRIEEYSYELVYKPGKSNIVADTLSRLRTEVNILSNDETNDPTRKDSVTDAASEVNSKIITASEVSTSTSTTYRCYRSYSTC